MKKDIRSFKNAKGTPIEVKGKLTEAKAAEMFDKFDENTKREARSIERTLRRYEGKSQSELMSELTRLADAERKNGTLDDAKLDAFARNVSPMLTKEQQQRLSGILGQLK